MRQDTPPSFVNPVKSDKTYNLPSAKTSSTVTVNLPIVKTLPMWGFWVPVDSILNGNSFFIFLNFGHLIFEEKKHIPKVSMLQDNQFYNKE